MLDEMELLFGSMQPSAGLLSPKKGETVGDRLLRFPLAFPLLADGSQQERPRDWRHRIKGQP